jgi:hypothetical protein
MSLTNLGTNILVKFALTSGDIGFFFLFGHYGGQYVETSFLTVFDSRNPAFESQIL